MTGDSAGTLMVSPVVRFLITPSSGLTELVAVLDLVHVVAVISSSNSPMLKALR